MKGLLLLSCVGAGIYALLLVTHDVLPGDKGEDTFAGQTQPNNQVAERPGSWNSYIRRRSLSQNPQLATSQQPVSCLLSKAMALAKIRSESRAPRTNLLHQRTRQQPPKAPA